MSTFKIIVEGFTLFIASIFVLIGVMFGFSGASILLTKSRGGESILLAIIMILVFIGTIILWIMEQKRLRKKIAEDNLESYVGTILSVAILVFAIIAIFLFSSYFGLYESNTSPPDQCLSSTGFGCAGKPDIRSEYQKFTLVNSMDITTTLDNTKIQITHTNLTCTGSNVYFCNRNDNPVSCGTNTIVLEDGQEVTIVIRCAAAPNQAVRAILVFNYTNPQTGFTESATAQIAGIIRK